MGWRGTLVLGVLVLIAGAYAYHDLASEPELSWDKVLGSERPTPIGQGSEPLVPVSPHDIAAVRLRRGAVDVSTERKSDGWSGVDGKAIDDFLDTLSTLSRIVTLDVGAEQLADHGLAPPQAIIDLQPRTGPPLEIRIGDRNPPATAVYVQIDAEPHVVLTGALILWELEKAIHAATGAA